VLSAPAAERSILECYYACRRQQSCQYEQTGDFGTSPIFVQLSGKPLLASIWLIGVLERKAQWPIEKYSDLRLPRTIS
jgi:hypothetical protein